MSQSQVVHLEKPHTTACFFPLVTSVLQILAKKDCVCAETEAETAAAAPNCTAFFRCIAGSGKIITSDAGFTLSENESIFVPAQEILFCKSCENRWEYRRVDFSSAHTGNAYVCKKVLHTPQSAAESRCFHSLLQAAAQNPTNRSYINALFLAYFYAVFPVDTAAQAKSADRHTAEELCAYLQQCIYEKRTVSEIAAVFSVTPRRLHQICTKKTGLSPKQYMQRLKMEEAHRLLTQTKMPVHQIAELLCFHSPYHFSNAFHSFYQASPQAVRRAAAQKSAYPTTSTHTIKG